MMVRSRRLGVAQAVFFVCVLHWCTFSAQLDQPFLCHDPPQYRSFSQSLERGDRVFQNSTHHAEDQDQSCHQISEGPTTFHHRRRRLLTRQRQRRQVFDASCFRRRLGHRCLESRPFKFRDFRRSSRDLASPTSQLNAQTTGRTTMTNTSTLKAPLPPPSPSTMM